MCTCFRTDFYLESENPTDGIGLPIGGNSDIVQQVRNDSQFYIIFKTMNFKDFEKMAKTIDTRSKFSGRK